MAKLAVIGQANLPDWVRRKLDAVLRHVIGRLDDHNLIGLSCLADGVDALFAQAILDLGGKLVAIVPARGYRDELEETYRPTYDALLDRAASVTKLEIGRWCVEAAVAAGLRMVNEADMLLAAYDGPIAELPVTADIVAYARRRDVPVVQIWPAEALGSRP